MKKLLISLLILLVPSMTLAQTVVKPSQGGTGTTTIPTSGQILIGGSNNRYDVKTLTAGSNITIDTSGGTVVISSSASGPAGSWATTSQDYYNSQFRDWRITGSPLYLTPTTTIGIIVNGTASSTIGKLTVTNGTTTNATSTNIFTLGFTLGTESGCASFASGILTGTGVACGTGAGAGGNSKWATTTNNLDITTNGLGGIILSASSTIDKLSVRNGTTTNATTTTLYVNSGGITTSGSTTLQNFTAKNATTTQATTTNFGFTGIANKLLATDASGSVIGTTTISTNLLNLKSFTVTTAAPLGGAATVNLGDTLALTCTGCLTANQTITLTGDVLGSGTTNIPTTLGPGIVNRDWKLFSPTILQPTTTPMGILVNNSTSTITNLFVVNGTTTNATSTNLSISGTLDIDQMTSALLLTGATGIVAEYAGSANPCTNQVPTTISALGALGGCTSINGSWWSGTDLAVVDGGTGLSTLGGTNRVIYTSTTDNLASEAAFTYDQATNILTADSFLANASSTFQNFTGINATTTAATSTNLYVSNRFVLNTQSGCASFTSGVLTGTGSACGSGGASTDKWASSSDSLGIYPNTITADVWIGSTATATAPFWFDVSATTTYIGNGAGDSIITLGTSSQAWSLGYLSADNNFYISSSTSLNSNNFLSIGKNGSSTIQSNLTIAGNATTTNATTTGLYVSGTTRLASLNGVLKGTTGVVSVAANGTDYTLVTAVSCTNQVVTALTAGGIGTCSSINNAFWSGTDLSVANGGTGLSTFGGTNHILYTGTADNLASEAAFTYNATTNLLTVDSIIGNGSSTIDALTMRLSTTSQATTTNMFSTWASSTNLFSSKFSVASSTIPANWGVAIATTTVISGAQITNTIASTTANAIQVINWDTGNTQRVMVTAATQIVVNATSSNPKDGGKYILKICQDPTGSRAVTYFPNALRWPTLGATPGATTTVSSAANSCTFIGMIYDSLYGVYQVMGSTTGIKIN